MTDKNLIQFKGEEQETNFVIEDDDGQPLDLTLDQVENVHLDVATGLAQYGETQFELFGEGLTTDGNVKFVIESEKTNNLKPGNYLYEVWVEYTNKRNYTAEVGKFFVKPRVDR